MDYYFVIMTYMYKVLLYEINFVLRPAKLLMLKFNFTHVGLLMQNDPYYLVSLIYALAGLQLNITRYMLYLYILSSGD